MAYQQMAAAAPTVAAGGWALYGHVFLPNAQSPPQPATGYTVFLVDSQKTYQEAYGFSYTDDKGYFALNHAGAQAPATQATGTQAPATPASGAQTTAPPAPANERAATYQRITLAGDEPIGDPPPPIRKTGMPGK